MNPYLDHIACTNSIMCMEFLVVAGIDKVSLVPFAKLIAHPCTLLY